MQRRNLPAKIALIVFCGGLWPLRPAPGAEIPAATRCALVLTRLGELTGYRPGIQVKSENVDRQALPVLLREALERDFTDEQIAAQEAAFRRFGLVPLDFKLKDTFLGLMGEQAGGFYLPYKRTLYVLADAPLQDIVLAHELTHALQDRRIGLERSVKALRDNDDATLAFQSVFEGQACLAMNAYATAHSSAWDMAVGMVKTSYMGQTQNSLMSSVPAVIRDSLLFPYVRGTAFMTKVLTQRQWAGTYDLLARPPQSTEQILHPDKFLKQLDQPSSFNLAGVVPALGGAWRARNENTLGEFGVRALLAARGEPRKTAGQAAGGWDGDRYLLLARNDRPEAAALVWLSTWDSPDHAHRFFETFSHALDRTSPHREEEPGRHFWTGPNSSPIMLTRWGQELLYCDGLDSAELKVLRDELTAAKQSGRLFAADHRAD